MLLPLSTDFISQGLCIWLLGTRKLKAASPVTVMGVSSQGLIRDKSGYSSPSCFHFCLDRAGSNAGRSELRSRGVVIDLKPLLCATFWPRVLALGWVVDELELEAMVGVVGQPKTRVTDCKCTRPH